MNRRQRRTQGKDVMLRINTLRNSKILNSHYLQGLSEEDKKILKEGKHENKSLQTLYNKASKLITELVFLEDQMNSARVDLQKKRGISPSE